MLEMNKIRLLLADDHAVLRAGLKTLFEAQPDMEVIAEAGDGDEAIREARNSHPDIVLMDITMPGMKAAEAIGEIKRWRPATRVLVLTVHEDEKYLYQMFRAGADSYVPKKAAATELIAAIRATSRGQHFVHPSMMAGLVSELRGEETRPLSSSEVEQVLSEREREVLRLVALGHTNHEIAERLYLSIKTVETYRTRFKVKLNLRGRADIVRYAMRQGLLDGEQ